MVEGSLWVYGQTDLTDYYRGALTLRQVWVRLAALPHEAPVMAQMRQEQEEAEAHRKAAAVQATLAKFGR